MDSFDRFISTLNLSQTKFIPKVEPPSNTIKQTMLVQEIKRPFTDALSQWKNIYELPDEEINQLEMVENGKNYSLYTSIMYLIYPKYQMAFTFNQRNTIIDEFVRFIIAKLDLDPILKKQVKDTKLRPNGLIDEIKDTYYQSPNVIFYLSIILDLNIIVLPYGYDTDHLELYHSEHTYDNCKPHIILGRDGQNHYNPVVFNGNTLLTYYDHKIIPLLLEYNKKHEVNLSIYQKIHRK